jgi:hypothetical protein
MESERDKNVGNYHKDLTYEHTSVTEGSPHSCVLKSRSATLINEFLLLQKFHTVTDGDILSLLLSVLVFQFVHQSRNSQSETTVP